MTRPAEFSKTKLEKRIVWLEGLTTVCVFVLIVGLVGESRTVTDLIVSDGKPGNPTFSVEVMSNGRLHKSFENTVIGSIAGEFVFGIMLIFSNRKRALADQAAISELQKEIALANRGAAEANEKAEKEYVERLKLQKSLEDREINSKELQQIARKFGEGMTLDVLLWDEAREPCSLALKIFRAMQNRGADGTKWRVRVWSVNFTINMVETMEEFPVGIWLRAGMNSKPETDPIIEEIAASLKASGNESRVGPKLVKNEFSEPGISAPHFNVRAFRGMSGGYGEGWHPPVTSSSIVFNIGAKGGRQFGDLL